MKKPFLLILAFALLCGNAYATGERYYQRRWCELHGGKAEVVLPDRTRADCLTETHAVEIEFARKWYEAPMQALHYARLTGKKALVVIICYKDGDEEKLQRLRDNVSFYNIPVETETLYCEP